jgi:hypothetical protein
MPTKLAPPLLADAELFVSKGPCPLLPVIDHSPSFLHRQRIAYNPTCSMAVRNEVLIICATKATQVCYRVLVNASGAWLAQNVLSLCWAATLSETAPTTGANELHRYECRRSMSIGEKLNDMSDGLYDLFAPEKWTRVFRPDNARFNSWQRLRKLVRFPDNTVRHNTVEPPGSSALAGLTSHEQ